MKTDSLPSRFVLERCARSISSVFLQWSAKYGLAGKRFKALFFLAIFGGYSWLIVATLYPPLPTPQTPLLFYANQIQDDLKRVILRAIHQANSSITLQIYGLTDPDVLSLLEKKRASGVDVTIFYDKKASGKGISGYPIQAGGLMHRKILIIDHALTLIGTANFTPHSLKMHDNMILGIWDKSFATFFEKSIQEKEAFDVGKTTITAFLLPEGGEKALSYLLAKIDGAKKTIAVTMFTLTHPCIVERLVAAQKRGVEISLYVDRYTAEGASQKSINSLLEAGALVFVSSGNQLLHHKGALIDEEIFIIGSANWTKSAFENNQDCLLVLENLSEREKKKILKFKKIVAKSAKKL